MHFVNGFRFSRGSCFAVRNRSTKKDVLIPLGTTVAFFFSDVVVVIKTVLVRTGYAQTHEKTVFDTAALLISILLLGEWLEAFEKRRTALAIEAISRLAPRRVDVVDTSNITTSHASSEVPVLLRGVYLERVSVADQFQVKEGTAFPIDGRIVEGDTVVDELILTGDSWSVRKTEGDDVISSTAIVVVVAPPYGGKRGGG